jgi:PIN domain nuclease of toxin-antitoxin system
MRVLDASAVLAWIFEEEGGELVEQLFEDGLISAVNYAEVLQRVLKRGETLETIVGEIDQSGLRIVDSGREAATVAAELYDRKDLSLADRFCIALGALADVPVVTADRDWATSELPVAVELIR